MSYRLKRKRFKCETCKNTYYVLVSAETTTKHCMNSDICLLTILGETCGMIGYEEHTRDDEEFKPEKKRQ